MIKILIESGSDIEIKDMFDKTALDYLLKLKKEPIFLSENLK